MNGGRPKRPRQPAAAGNRRLRQPAAAGNRTRTTARGLGGEQVEGRQAVAELLAAGRRRVTDVWVESTAEPAPILDRIDQLAGSRRVPVRRVSPARLEAEARTGAPQGVLAHAQALPEAGFDDLCRSGKDGAPPFLLALDSVTDPQNLGAVLRSAEGAGASGAVLARHRSVHVTPAVTKAAAGAVEHVPIALVGGIPAALARASEAGLWVVGLDPAASESVFDLAVGDQGLVLVLGAEGKGLSRLAASRCDALVRIPLRGALESLNVSAAGAVALFEVSRRRSR